MGEIYDSFVEFVLSMGLSETSLRAGTKVQVHVLVAQQSFHLLTVFRM